MHNSASTACRALPPGDGNQSPIQVELLQYGAGGNVRDALALIICSLLKERSIPPKKGGCVKILAHPHLYYMRLFFG